MNLLTFSQKTVLNENGDTLHILTNSQAKFLIKSYHKSEKLSELLSVKDSVIFFKNEQIVSLVEIITELENKNKIEEEKTAVYLGELIELEKDVNRKERKLRFWKGFSKVLVFAVIGESAALYFITK